jgi:electron transfer flavoprotein alpha/beta subunit
LRQGNPNPEIATSVFRVDETKKEVIPVPGLPLVTSPFDEQAIEAALRIRRRTA